MFSVASKRRNLLHTAGQQLQHALRNQENAAGSCRDWIFKVHSAPANSWSCSFVRSFSRRAKGKLKPGIVKHNWDITKPRSGTDQFWDSDEDDILYEPSQVVPSDDEDSLDPDSLVARLEDVSVGPVLHILHQWVREGKETHEGVVAALKRLKWLERYKQAYEISDWVIHERRLELEKFHFINHLELVGRVVSMQEAENFRRSMPYIYRASEAAYMTMFENYVVHQSLRSAKQLLKEMKQRNLLTTAKAFNKLFSLASKKGQEYAVPILLREMREMRLSPNIETYVILIGMKATNGDTDGMERLFNKMKCDGDATPTCELLCALASGYVKAGMNDKAMAYLKQVVDSEEFMQTRKVHDKVIALYAQMKKINEMDRVWRFTRKFPVISAGSYISAIVAYEKVGELLKAEVVFKELAERKQSLRPIHYNALLGAYCEAGQMWKAEKLVEKMRKGNCPVNGMSYQHLVTGYMKTGNPKMAIEALNRGLNERVGLTFDTMMMILKQHSDDANVDEAELLFQWIRRASYSKTVKVYNLLLKTYVNAGKHAYRFLQRLAVDQVAPNAETFLLLNQMKPIPKLCADDGIVPSLP